MDKYVLVYNPLSGDASFKYQLDRVIEQFQNHGCLLLPYRIMTREDTIQFSRLAKDVKANGIIVSGGDGTVNEIVNLMMTERLSIPLGIIPSGTCNDFATYLGMSNNLTKCIDTILSGAQRQVDVGRVNDRFFINVASAGLLTSVAHMVDPIAKNTLGKIAYYLKGIKELPNFRPLSIKINADGIILEDELFLFLVMNSKTAGSFTNLAPLAEFDDGKLDLLMIKRCNLTELTTLFIRLLAGDIHNHKNITYIQAKKLFIECNEPLESDVDGERGPQLPLQIETLQGALTVFCGSHCN